MFRSLVEHHIQPGLPSLSVLWGHRQQPSMGPTCGLVGPGIYPASSRDPGECKYEEAIDETQTTKSRVRLYLFKGTQNVGALTLLSMYFGRYHTQNVINGVSWIQLLSTPNKSKDLNQMLDLFKILIVIHKNIFKYIRLYQLSHDIL